MDKKKRIVLDAGENTALFVEQDSEGSYLATMYPFKESSLTLKIWAYLAWSLFSSVLFTLTFSFILYSTWLVLTNIFPDYSLIFGFVLSGLFLLTVLWTKQLFLKAKDELEDKRFVLVREVLREMKNECYDLEQYSIKSSYLYRGLDGDFITWYKQEKNKAYMKRSF